MLAMRPTVVGGNVRDVLDMAGLEPGGEAVTRTKSRTKLAIEAAAFINAAAQLAEKEACRVCKTAESQVLGHTECWKFVRLSREIRKLGEEKQDTCTSDLDSGSSQRTA